MHYAVDVPGYQRHEVTVREMWFAVARIREKNGDKAEAERARRNARAQPNQEFKKKFANCKAQCIVWKECSCPKACANRAREDPEYCIRKALNGADPCSDETLSAEIKRDNSRRYFNDGC